MTTQDEIEMFFKNAAQAMFCEHDRSDEMGQPLLFLFFNPNLNYDTHIHSKISEYFNDNESKLIIFISNNEVTRLSLVDINTANSINIDVSIIGSIEDFKKTTAETETIYLLTAFSSGSDVSLPLETMVKNPAAASGAARLLFVAKHIERIGDYVKDICELNVYLTEAVFIKHGSSD